jgi:hypothetical protein
MGPTTLYNTDPQVWEKAAKYYRARPGGGPTFKVLEGNVWGVPKTGWVARFASSEEAERVISAAGFRFVPEEKGFRVCPPALRRTNTPRRCPCAKIKRTDHDEGHYFRPR